MQTPLSENAEPGLYVAHAGWKMKDRGKSDFNGITQIGNE